MKLLVLGGTRFVGRHFVASALARGHEVTLFHRGRTNPGLFPGVDEVLGDRDRDLDRLKGRRWDAVVDSCGYVPRQVREAAAVLAGVVDLYLFISTISVYADFRIRGLTESSPVKQPPSGGEATEEVTDRTYGWLKVLCERALEEAMPGRAAIVRPGILVGPHDPTGRFTYWPWRVSRGGEVLAPGRPGRSLQILDARDLGEWLVSLLERGRTGLYNAPGPGQPLTFSELLETCRAVTGSDAAFIWVEESFLLDHLDGGTEPPLWGTEEKSGFDSVDNTRARSEGLAFRPLAETVRDTLDWLSADSEAQRHPSSFPPEAETRLLRLWHSR